MKTYTRKDVQVATAKAFQKSERAAVLAYLSMYGEDASEPEQRRVQLAVLNLSRGDLQRLVHFLSAAKKDYRDILRQGEHEG